MQHIALSTIVSMYNHLFLLTLVLSRAYLTYGFVCPSQGVPINYIPVLRSVQPRMMHASEAMHVRGSASAAGAMRTE